MLCLYRFICTLSSLNTMELLSLNMRVIWLASQKLGRSVQCFYFKGIHCVLTLEISYPVSYSSGISFKEIIWIKYYLLGSLQCYPAGKLLASSDFVKGNILWLMVLLNMCIYLEFVDIVLEWTLYIGLGYGYECQKYCLDFIMKLIVKWCLIYVGRIFNHVLYWGFDWRDYWYQSTLDTFRIVSCLCLHSLLPYLEVNIGPEGIERQKSNEYPFSNLILQSWHLYEKDKKGFLLKFHMYP